MPNHPKFAIYTDIIITSAGHMFSAYLDDLERNRICAIDIDASLQGRQRILHTTQERLNDIIKLNWPTVRVQRSVYYITETNSIAMNRGWHFHEYYHTRPPFHSRREAIAALKRIIYKPKIVTVKPW